MSARGDMEAEEVFSLRRSRMVDEQIVRRGVTSPDVVCAMRTVPRHLFVPESERVEAYADGPLPIGCGQTISQPYIVASMTEELRLNHTSRVLEIGTGSGYQTAVLAEIAAQVFTIEIVPQLFERTSQLLQQIGYQNVFTRLGDGHFGWPEEAPFDGIMITAAADQVPPALIEQLRPGGRMVLPIEEHDRQELVLLYKTSEGVRRQTLYDVRFVPLVFGEQ